MKTAVVLLAALAGFSSAQYGDGGSGSSSMAPSSTAASPASTTGSGSSATHTIQVGLTGLSFSPDSVSAKAGEVLEFHYGDDKEHSVAQSSFAAPCKPSSPGIYSGFLDQSSVFQVTVNDTTPLWFYCSQVSHCQSGMAMVVNQPSSGPNTLDAYKTAAKKAAQNASPSSASGGMVKSSSSLSSSSGNSSSSGSPSGSGSATSSPSAASSGAAAPTGVAWMQAGGAAALLAVAGLMV